MQISNTAKFTATVKILIDFLDVIFKFITNFDKGTEECSLFHQINLS